MKLGLNQWLSFSINFYRETSIDDGSLLGFSNPKYAQLNPVQFSSFGGRSTGTGLAKHEDMKEMLQKIIVIILMLLSVYMHPEKQITGTVYHFLMNHSETVRAAAQLIHIIQSL